MGQAPTLQSVLDATRPLITAGAALHWLKPFQKRPIRDNWSTAARLDEAGLRSAYETNANIGIRPGEPSKTRHGYLHVIDLDIKKDEHVDLVWGKLLEWWPQARSFPSVISGSCGHSRHIYFLTDKPFRKTTLAYQKGVSENEWEIVLMGTGSNLMIPPSIHPDTKQPYYWERALDFDMPVLMRVPSEMVETWGGRTDEPRNADDDDLLSLMAQEPLDLTEDEIDTYLADIPNSGEGERAGQHYDDFLNVGMALHHQFRGSNEGYTKWLEWAEQSPKFDERECEKKWKSFAAEKRENPVTFRSVISIANNNRFAAEHDFEALGDDDGFSPPAVIPSGSTSRTSLLDDTPPLPSIHRAEAQMVSQAPPRNDEFSQLLARNEDGDLKAGAHNASVLFANDIRTYGIVAQNEFTEQIVLRKTPAKIQRKERASAKPVVNLEGRLWQVKDRINGDNWHDSHDMAVRLAFEAPSTQGGYGFKISDRDLRAAVDAAANQHAFHPVRDTISSVRWDGRMRVERLFIDYLGCPDTSYHRAASMMFLVGAVARVFEPGHKFDFVPILEGAQGKGKSTFIRTLAMSWYNELTGDISDVKQMVETMQGSWIMELGELSAMHRSEVNDLKSFVSRTSDRARLAYDKRAKDYLRQCVFIGSTNDDEYLRDATGNRRMWPIKCDIEGQIDNPRLMREVAQVWAEALAMYREMRARQPFGDLPLYLNDRVAADEAVLIQTSRRVETPEDVLAGVVGAWLDIPLGDEDGFEDLDGDVPKRYRDHTCTAEIWEEVMAGRKGQINNADTQKIGRALKAIGWRPSAGVLRTHPVNAKYGPCRVYFRNK